MTDDITAQLKKIAIFSGLSEDILATIAQKAVTRKLAAGEALAKKGDPGNSMFLIHKGLIKITSVDDKGNELIINKWGPGGVVGEMALLDGGVRSANVVVQEDAEVLEISRETFEGTLNDPAVSLAVIKDSFRRLRFATTYIEKTIDLAKKLSVGDYSFLEKQQEVNEGSDDSKAAQMLSEFFKMARKVKEREDTLKKQLEKLTFEIDQTRRKQEVAEITGTEFYANLKEQAKNLRQKRSQNEEKQ